MLETSLFSPLLVGEGPGDQEVTARVTHNAVLTAWRWWRFHYTQLFDPGLGAALALPQDFVLKLGAG